MEPVVLAVVVSLAPWLLYVLPHQVLQDHQRRPRRLVVRQQVYGLHCTRGAHYKRTSFFEAIPLSQPFDLDTVSYEPSVVRDLTLSR